MYGPVAGRGTRSPRGVLAGCAVTHGIASLYRRSGSGALRWNVTVFGPATIPFERSQPFLEHDFAPRIRLKYPKELPWARRRSSPRRKSAACTAAPFE